MKPQYNKHIFPICIGQRPIKMSQIANSGENCGFSYHVKEIQQIFFSLYDFPLTSELEALIKDFGNRFIQVDYEEWYPCGDENYFQCDRELTSKMCYFLNSYFNLKYPYYQIEFIPGNITAHDSQFKVHGPFYYYIDIEPSSLIN